MTLMNDPKMNIVDVNDVMIRSRKDIKRAKVRIINKLVRNIRILKNKKSTESQKEVNLKKAEELLQEIDVIKDLKVDSIFKFLLVTQLTINQLPAGTNIQEKCMVRIGSVPFIKHRIEELKKQFSDFNKLRSNDGHELPSSIKIAAKVEQPNVERKRNEETKKQIKKTKPKPKKSELERSTKHKSSIVKPIQSAQKMQENKKTENQKMQIANEEVAPSILSSDLTYADHGNEIEPSVEPDTSTVDPPPAVNDIQQRLLGISSYGNETDNTSEYFNNLNDKEDDFFAQRSDSYHSEEEEDYVLEEHDDGMQVVLPTYYAKLKRMEEDNQQPCKQNEPRVPDITKSKTNDVTELFTNLGEGFGSSEDEQSDIDENKSAINKEETIFFTNENSKHEQNTKRRKPVNISASSSIFLQSLSTMEESQLKGKKKNRPSQRKRQKQHLIKTGKVQRNPYQKASKESRKTSKKEGQLPTGMHPSWEASLKRKREEKSLPAFAGKKICFDDSD